MLASGLRGVQGPPNRNVGTYLAGGVAQAVSPSLSDSDLGALSPYFAMHQLGMLCDVLCSVGRSLAGRGGAASVCERTCPISFTASHTCSITGTARFPQVQTASTSLTAATRLVAGRGCMSSMGRCMGRARAQKPLPLCPMQLGCPLWVQVRAEQTAMRPQQSSRLDHSQRVLMKGGRRWGQRQLLLQPSRPLLTLQACSHHSSGAMGGFRSQCFYFFLLFPHSLGAYVSSFMC